MYYTLTVSISAFLVHSFIFFAFSFCFSFPNLKGGVTASGVLILYYVVYLSWRRIYINPKLLCIVHMGPMRFCAGELGGGGGEGTVPCQSPSIKRRPLIFFSQHCSLQLLFCVLELWLLDHTIYDAEYNHINHCS